MKSERPLISAIVPAYNAEAFLTEAIQSIQQQAYEPLEIIVVDDGSTDRTAEIASSFSHSIRYVYQENSGPAQARNTGLNLAQGEIISFLDVDDLWPNNKIKIQLDYFAKNSSLEVVVGRVQVLCLDIDSEGIFKKFAQPAFGVHLGAGLYKKSVFEKVGYFDPMLRQCQDLDLCMRLRENDIAIGMIEPVTLYYRLHKNNLTKQKEQQTSMFLKAFKQSLNRRRQIEDTASSLPSLLYINQKSSSDNTPLA